MEASRKRIWQVAASDTERNCADLCLRWDVILNGPGAEGPWPHCAEALRSEWGLSSRKLSDLRRFCEEMKDGDLVVLRVGTTDVYGVGAVVGDYVWHEEFGDVDGWSLEHVRRVRWLWKYDGEPKRFKPYTLRPGDTVQLMDSPPVLDWIAALPVEREALDRPLDCASISQYLFDRGVASSTIERLTDQIHEIGRIGRWHQRTSSPSEAETIAHIVTPLLRALGWTPQKMAVGWSGLDLVHFRSLPRCDENLATVVEVKRKGQACLRTPTEARAFAEQPGRESWRRLIVTEGLRYAVYLREGGRFKNSPDAYLNLARMRDEYPLFGCKGAKDALLLMAADWAG